VRTPVSLYLSASPLWLSAFVVVVLPTIAAAWCLVKLRRRLGLKLLASNNEVAGFKFAVVGVIYAVMLAFAVIIVWERYTEAEVAVVQEAGAAAALRRLATGSGSDALEMRRALRNYLSTAIERDWPRMAAEQNSPEVTVALDQLYAAAVRLAEGGSQHPAVLVEMFRQIDALTQARGARIHLAIGIVPSVLWGALALGGILTVTFTFFFATANLRAQIAMTCILSVIVLMGLFVIISIDHPFTGPVHVGSEPLQRVLEDSAETPQQLPLRAAPPHQ
jgi:Protein of unknown function (DUF4239)